MSKKISNIIKIFIFLLIGIGLFWLVYRKQDVNEIKDQLLKADLWWLLVSMILGLLSHISRSMRWKMLIEPVGYKPRTITLFYSVMIMYLTNYAIPRSGEVVRAGVVSRQENIPFTALLGTIITERAIDFIMLFLLTIIVLISQFSVFEKFIANNAQATQRIDQITSSIWIIAIIIIAIILVLVLMYVYRNKIKQTKLYKKFQESINNFVNGIKSVKNVRNKTLFFIHTIFIWAMYFIMIYVVFQAFDFTKNLSLMTGLTVFVFASFGIVFPSPGGIGTWHFIAIETLFVYGIPKNLGRTFAFAAHESQMIMLITVGLISLVAVSMQKKKELVTQKI